MESHEIIIKLQPNLIHYIIPGGELIHKFLGLPKVLDNPSQLWVASLLEEALPNGKNGLSLCEESLQSRTLKDVIAENPTAFLGKKHVEQFGETTEILFKLLNSKDRLLVQAHPNTAQAKKYFNLTRGKNEAWYVVDSEEDAKVYIGFREHVTPQLLRELIDKQDTKEILNCLHCFDLQVGDVIFVPANTPHAMGKNSLVAEIQESCAITLRAERFRPDGSELPEESLHSGIGVDAMLTCFDFTTRTEQETRDAFFVSPKEVAPHEVALMPEEAIEFFDMHRISCSDRVEKTNESFVIGFVLEGKGTISCGDFAVDIEQGSEFLIPHGVAKYAYHSDETLTILECYPPKIES